MAPLALAFAMQKGGVGKTTLAVNIAAACAGHLGLRTLVVDLDGQRNATSALLGTDEEIEPNILTVVHQEIPMSEVMRPTSFCERLFVVPGSRTLAMLEKRIDENQWEAFVAEAPASIRPLYPEDFDVVIVDTPPSLGLWMQIALAAVDAVAMVAQPEYFSMRAIPEIVETIDAVRTTVHPHLVTAGLIVNQVKAFTIEHASFLTAYREQLGDLVLEPPVPDRIAVTESQSQHIPVEFLNHRDAPETREIFRRLAVSLLERVRNETAPHALV